MGTYFYTQQVHAQRLEWLHLHQLQRWKLQWTRAGFMKG